VRPYTDDEILHVPGMGYDGICGMSPIAWPARASAWRWRRRSSARSCSARAT
jgi:hypothetical protein